MFMKREDCDMEINKKSLRELSELSDDQLRDKINSVAASCGIDASKTAPYISDMAAVKKKLSSLTEAQIKAFLNALGEENVKKIKNGLDNGQRR